MPVPVPIPAGSDYKSIAGSQFLPLSGTPFDKVIFTGFVISGATVAATFTGPNAEVSGTVVEVDNFEDVLISGMSTLVPDATATINFAGKRSGEYRVKIYPVGYSDAAGTFTVRFVDNAVARVLKNGQVFL